MNIGGVLARFERALKEGRLPGKETLQHWHDWLEGLHYSLDINDPNYGRVYRLLEEVDWPEEVWSEHAAQGSTTVPAGAHRDGDPECDCYSCDYDRDQASGAAQGAMRKVSERQLPCHYPKLYEVCEADPELIAIIEAMSESKQRDADKIRAMKGPDAAAAFVRGQAA